MSLFSLVSSHWPKIATALVVGVGLIELFLDLGASDSNIEWYLLAWGSMTGGLWFLFDIAEKSAAPNLKIKIVNWINGDERTQDISAIPERFASLFDQIFGEKHLSWVCFRRSAIASITSAWVVSTLVFGINPAVFGDGFVSSLPDPVLDESLINVGMLGVMAVFINIIPDYLSLLQTRYMMKWIQRGRNTFFVLIADVVVTAVIFVSLLCTGQILIMLVTGLWLFTPGSFEFLFMNDSYYVYRIIYTVQNLVLEMFFVDRENGSNLGILLITTFFTSIWLWLYMFAMWASRVLVGLNNGVGFLLKLVDVESQPFRSLGFVSVLLVSILFLIGLPFVLLSPSP